MKKFLVILFLSLVLVSTSGCQPSGPGPGETKTHPLMDKQMTLVAPPAPWEEQLKMVEEGVADLGHEAGTVVGVTYTKPENKGLMAVGVIGQQKKLIKDKDGKPKLKDGRRQYGEYIELTDDQETLNQIALWVTKREGERLKEEWITVLGQQAFHMVFEFGSGKQKQKGEQVHFTREGTHYTLSILVPASDYDAEIPHFRRLVESFKITEGAKKAEKKTS